MFVIVLLIDGLNSDDWNSDPLDWNRGRGTGNKCLEKELI
jgi:hypothetical protein